MENTNRPDERQASDQGPFATEMGPNALERQGAEQSRDVETAWSKLQPGDRADPFDESEHRHDRQPDYDKVLVERIGDVDHDMRATAFRLQRALQTQRREIDKRLQRHARLLGVLVLFTILLAIALLFLGYRQFRLESPRVAAEVSEERSIPAQVREGPERVTTQSAESVAAPGEPSGGSEQARKSPATDQTAGERTRGHGAGEPRRPGVGQDKPVRDPESPQSLEDGSATAPLTAGSPSAADGSDGTRGADSASEKAGEKPAEATGPKIGDGEVPAGSTAAPITVASTSTAEDGSGDTRDAGSAPEKAGEDRPAEETVGTSSPRAGAVPADQAAAGDAADFNETHTVPAGSYALQLVSYSDRESLDRFVARKELPARVYIIRQTYRRRPWHSVIHSLHASYAAAEKELSRLPADLTALGPWIRPLPEGTELRVIETGPE